MQCNAMQCNALGWADSLYTSGGDAMAITHVNVNSVEPNTITPDEYDYPRRIRLPQTNTIMFRNNNHPRRMRECVNA